ncbi:MAG TPA: alanine racemase [Tianweitania sediminis]|jgi:D-serine deaminase-like pyridoxal phosphate-dependent protein|nr:alanine racemase [Tianweitania sediminis]
MTATSIGDLQTPCLLLCSDRLDRNVARLRDSVERRGAVYRPHLKTAKSIDVTRRALRSPADPVTVSTLKEAETFLEAGLTDMIYAVGIAAAKIGRVRALRARGVDLAVLVDSVEQARTLADAPHLNEDAIPAFIEIDCDGHRSGVDPTHRDLLVRIAAELTNGAGLRGVLTHCGSSYSARDAADLEAWARRERDAVLLAAAHLRKAGFDVPIVSLGSTPTALAEIDLEGVTEVRAGVGMFFDLVQSGVGVCSPEDIAISVLTTVIGKQHGCAIVDAGWMAMSRDRGTAAQPLDWKYGLVCDERGRAIEDLLLLDANQEHGIVGMREGSGCEMPVLDIGARLRVLPNHACATAAQHDCYHVVSGSSPTVHERWDRFGGW